jgi:hypothetical protein
MEIKTGQRIGDLIPLSKDFGRRVHGPGTYWKCVCICGKPLSVKDKDMTNGVRLSCKMAGRPCQQVDRKTNKIVAGDIIHGHKVIHIVQESGGYLKSYYEIECTNCKFRSQKRGDTIISGEFKKCECLQSTENQKSSS